MPVTRSITTSILLALSLASIVSSAPTVTEGLARRSTVSNGVVCSFECPDLGGDFDFISGVGQDDVDWRCNYQGPEGSPNCVYSIYSGAIDPLAGSSSVCPAKAAGPFCGTNPDGNQYFKRSLPAPRKRSAAEQAIAQRQYKPKRNVARANEVEEEREV